MNTNQCHAVCFVNNSISAKLAYDIIRHDNIDLSHVALIKLRKFPVEWEADCGLIIDYGKKPSLSFVGQFAFLSFYRKTALIIKKILNNDALKEVYVCNNDNILCSHVIQSYKLISARITVLSEGIMNYQNIGLSNRAWWRWISKPVIAFFLGLRYKIPTSHLSGAYEPGVQRVIAFSAHGLKSPEEKILLFPFLPVQVTSPLDKESALLVHTGLWQWMPSEKYDLFAKRFVQWIHAQKFTKIYHKNHPHIPTGILSQLLPESIDLGLDGAVEKIAAQIQTGTVIGTCCTALGTIKLLRPDLRCIDYGADYYCKYAYHDDLGVIDFLEGCGVEVIAMDKI